MASCFRLLVLSSCMIYAGCPAPSSPTLPGRDGGSVGGGDAGVVADGGAVQACTETRDCPADQVCVEGACEVPFTGCRSDRDCDEGATCYEGVCIR